MLDGHAPKQVPVKPNHLPCPFSALLCYTPPYSASMVTSKPAKFPTTMASLLVPLIILIISHPLLCSNSKTHHARKLFSSTSAINSACHATQLPQLCKSSLSNLSADATPQQIITSAMELSSDAAKNSHLLSTDLLTASRANANVTAAANNCVEFMEYSIELIDKSKKGETEQGIKDVKAWMSAALAYEYDCASDLRYVNYSDRINAVIRSVDYATNLSSNALSMVDAMDIYGANMALWKPPSTERSSNAHDRVLLDFPGYGLEGNEQTDVVPDVTVSKEQGGSVSSIQAAVDAAPDYSARKFVIHIRAGVYEETVRIPRSKTNLAFIGEGMEKTVIRGSRYVPSLPGAVTVYDSATVGVNGDGFVARDLTFENAYEGPLTHQAVALRVDSDLSAFYRCAFLSHQDTLYTHTLRQFYKNCTIKGTHDFIFGNAAAIFEKCTIRVRPRQLRSKSGEKDPVTAQGRTDPAQSTGFVFSGCSVDGTEDYLKDFRANPSVHRVYLGRPWKMYSRTVFLNSYLGKVIRPEGWMAWNGTFALDTLFYGEFQNYGPGADISGRVSWCNQISEKRVGIYSVQSFIQGLQWLPATHI